MIVGCYVLHLYCDSPQCPEIGMYEKSCDPEKQRSWNEFTANTRSEAVRNATRLGWRFAGGDTRCPSCSGKRKLKK